ncbi:hypothetical protein [Streptomyces sp. NPDC048508]|uniref:hypothetical protein n=1 Tax=Streptomyces sp. NPDC048508 TaxID=3365561 RepID=UPI003717AEBA
MKAHVASVELTDNGNAFTIAWERPDGTTGTQDALELAQAAVKGWRQFLNKHHMDEKGA